MAPRVVSIGNKVLGPSRIGRRGGGVGGGGISADILTDLEGHYALEETVGSTAADSTANARDGSIATGAAWSELSIVGSSCGEFDGANAYIDLPTMGMPTGADACSVVLWVNPSGSAGDRNIASNHSGRVGDTGKSYLELRLSDTNKVLLTVGNQQVGSGTIESTATIPTGTWTQIIATYDGSRTRAGLKLYVNNAEATVTETGTASWTAGTDTDDWVLGGASGGDKGSYLVAGTLDDVRLYSRVLAEADRTELYALRNAAAAPVAVDVAISGTETEDETLTGSYTYYSNYGYAEGTTTFRWLRDDVAIDGATSTTYTLVTADVGTVITFEVTPISSVAPTTGTPVVSAGTGTIAANVAPVASSVAFTGTETVGEVLTRTYSYSDADGDSEGSSTTQWYRADNGSGLNEAAIAGATSATYTLVSADEAKFIRVGVTPVAATGTSPGTEAFSSYTGAIAAAAVPWTPADITTAAWWDLSDSGNVTESSGLISQIDDIGSVGTYHLLQAAGSRQPDYTANTINGLATATFDGSADKMKTASNPFGASIANATVILVSKPLSTTTTGTLLTLTGNETLGTRWQCHGPWSNNTFLFDVVNNTGTNRLQVASGYTANNDYITCFQSETTGKEIWVDGISLASNAASTPNPVTASSGIDLGGNVFYQNIAIGEVVVINGVLSVSDRQKLEGYLAHKWGLEGSLDAGHPYKSAPPTV